MLNLEIIRLVTECLLVVMIWPIQLVIYPSFQKLNINDQARVHLHYTLLISAIASPIIIIHFITTGYELLLSTNLFTILRLLATSIAIAVTFFLIAPIHLAILIFEPTNKQFIRITQRNWIRTIAWTTSLILTLTT